MITRPAALFGALAATVLFGTLAGCGEKPQVVEVVSPSEKKPARETPRRQARRPSSAASAPAPRAAATPTPKLPPQVKVLLATEMPNTPGKPDGEGGVVLPMNGPIEIDNYEIAFPVREIVVEMKGRPANSVWPEVVLGMYNRTTQKNVIAMPKTYASSPEYQSYRFPQKVALEPGKYLVTFRFLNNMDIPATGEDRAVWLRKIEFHEEPLP